MSEARIYWDGDGWKCSEHGHLVLPPGTPPPILMMKPRCPKCEEEPMSEVEWVDEVPKQIGKADRVSKELREHPEQWARIAQGVSYFTTPFQWWVKLVGNEDYEVEYVKVDAYTKDVYARFVGRAQK